MIGSTIVYIQDLSKNKSNIFDKIMNQNVFEQIELEVLTSLDFAIITNLENLNWERDNNPVALDEENGAVLLHISEAGLKAVINFIGDLENVDLEKQKSDIEMLKNFTEKFGFENLYEFVIF